MTLKRPTINTSKEKSAQGSPKNAKNGAKSPNPVTLCATTVNYRGSADLFADSQSKNRDLTCFVPNIFFLPPTVPFEQHENQKQQKSSDGNFGTRIFSFFRRKIKLNFFRNKNSGERETKRKQIESQVIRKCKFKKDAW